MPSSTSAPGAPATVTRRVQNFKASRAEERRRNALQNLDRFVETPLDGGRQRAKRSDLAQDAAMKAWKSFFDILEVDPDRIWLDLCRGSSEAEDHCRTFLDDFVAYSERPCLDLGPEEYKMERSVKAAYSVESIWRILIRAADDTVLKEKRLADPDRKVMWTLQYITGEKTRGKGPVANISYWIATDLSEKYGLTLKQTFTKTEITEQDVLLILTTLWTRANDISCDRRTRVAFHCVVLLASIGGFRPGALLDFSYSQIRLAVVRDPAGKAPKLVAWITIHHNKVRQDVIRRSQNDVVEFAVTTIPCQICCLATLIAVQAIHDDAFDTAFSSLDDLLQRPNREGVDYVQLNWKPGMADRKIFPLPYHTYSTLWYRTLLVAGFRKKVRLYAMRVGAGGRLDGSLTPAVRNHVLSNSTAVFNVSYQPNLIPHDLARVAFGQLAGQNDSLFALLRHSSLSRDEQAPIYPTKEDLKSFEQRQDMRQLRARYAALKADKSPTAKQEVNQIMSQISKNIEALSALVVEKRRAEYFHQIDRRRASGLPIGDLQNPQTNPRKTRHGNSGPPALIIGQFLLKDDIGTQPGGSRTALFGRLLAAFLGGRDADMMRALISTQAPVLKPATESDSPKSVCLLCGQPFTRHGNLTRHNSEAHIKKGHFRKPFPCPVCRKHGLKDHIIEDAIGWSNHVATLHGKHCAPNLPKQSTDGSAEPTYRNRTSKKRALCLFCGFGFFPGQYFSRHLNAEHVRDGIFDEPFHCPECQDEELWIHGLSEWKNHVKEIHGGDNGALLVDEDSDRIRQANKRKRHDEDRRSGDVRFWTQCGLRSPRGHARAATHQATAPTALAHPRRRFESPHLCPFSPFSP
ncbi:hypothetical protein RB593_005776 [Gaeumannomyces tritici]